MFNDYYGLTFNPFDKQSVSENDCFQSDDFRQMSSRLNYLKEIRGIGVFTAAPGMGKSYALRCFAKDLNPNLYHMEYLCLSTISVSDFYKQLCSVLGLNDRGSKTSMFHSIQDEVYSLYKDKKRPLILAIDEAQYLNAGILEDLKMLMNHGFDSLNCFSLILCGESYLNNTLSKPVHEALRQRITVHYNYNGLSDDEVSAYIFHKLERAGGSKNIINEASIGAVHSYSGGNPRLIDNVLTDAIIIGSQHEKKVIDADTILEAISNQNLF